MTKTSSAGRCSRVLLAVLAAGLLLRLWGLRWGFPLLVNGDEPHFVDTAVSFGAGSLNPHDFKYPTLWMYALSAAYGAYYLAWSLFGLRRSVAQFGALFVWQTWRFHWIGRCLAAGLSSLGLWAVARADEENRGAVSWPWAAALLAVSPSLVSAAHEAKADSLMFFLSALALLFALRLLDSGRPREAAASGFFAGLAFSAQYTGLPSILLGPLAALLRVFSGRDKSKVGLPLIAYSGASSALGFFLGCPYAFLDFGTFRSSLADHAVYHVGGTFQTVGSWQALSNPFLFSGYWSAAEIALPIGAIVLWRRDRARAALLALPVFLWAVFLSRQHDGDSPRYLLSCYPAIAVLSSAALSSLPNAILPLTAALALLPGLWTTASMDRLKTLPDTRQEATAWIEGNIPAGTAILLDQADVSPEARMTKEQAGELEEKNRERGSMRARYYALMAASHPGGGWRVYRLKRSAYDLNTNPRLVEKSQNEGATVDASAGLSALREHGIDYVVTSSLGARPERAPELARFFEELKRQGTVVARFAPDDRSVAGPTLQIYRIGHGGT